MHLHKTLISILLILSVTIVHSSGPQIIVITQEDLLSDDLTDSSASFSDEFPDYSASVSDDDLNPGSWRPIFESYSTNDTVNDKNSLYYSGVKNMIEAVTSGETDTMEASVVEFESAAEEGNPHAQSVLGFLYGAGIGKRVGKGESFLFHNFAANGGDLHSKMVLAYTCYKQDMLEKAAKLYAELAEASIASFLITQEPPVLEPVRIHSGTEENKEALKKSRGEDNEDFQMTEYQALKGNSLYMFKIGVLYYYGLRGLKRDHGKAAHWFSMAAEKREPRAMEFLGEMYARGAGVEKNYTKALQLLKLAADMKHYSAYNGLGFLYAKGYGVDQKNFTKAKEYFEKAAKNKDYGGHYNLGVLYLKGIGVERDVRKACQLFLAAADAAQPKALYQIAKMFHEGKGLRRNLRKAIYLYKVVAERGPWSSLSRWALESYLKGEVGKALLLYSRMAELGYEVAQSNAAWILDKYGEHDSVCMGESGLCTDRERHLRAHSLWWQASEQGNEEAALLIGDAYYYGRGIERDYERAAEAYMYAQTQANAQAMFNLGYMHEHGEGLPVDLHLAKRYYDQALMTDQAAKLPVMLALASLWLRKNYKDSFMVGAIDALPGVYPRLKGWVDDVVMDEANVTILTLFLCLLAVLYLRHRPRR